ncbi:MAG: DUF4337 domain-containing protein [Gammaproteobacteria bacterium]|nr:DUF4337 domain-containing protein [Gammaproteobacteria bacterium]
MSGHGIHVHAAHDHEVEHQAHKGPGLAQYIAIFTALLAALGALIGYKVATTLNEAMLYKNEAVLKKTEASDQWNFYQAKSSKQHLMNIAAALTTGKLANDYKQQVARYDDEKKEIKAKAESLEAASHQANEHSAELLHPLHLSEQAMTLIQIAISLASITALTRKRWLFAVAGFSAGGALILTIMSFMA